MNEMSGWKSSGYREFLRRPTPVPRFLNTRETNVSCKLLSPRISLKNIVLFKEFCLKQFSEYSNFNLLDIPQFLNCHWIVEFMLNSTFM